MFLKGIFLSVSHSHHNITRFIPVIILFIFITENVNEANDRTDLIVRELHFHFIPFGFFEVFTDFCIDMKWIEILWKILSFAGILFAIFGYFIIRVVWKFMRLASSCFGSIPKFNGKCSLVIINDNEKQSIKLNAKFNYIIINKKHSKKTNGGAILKIKKKFLKKVFKTLTTLFFFVTLVWSPGGVLQTHKF